jgi:ribonuclease BN (tRNA processing enzyme)
LIKSSNLVCVSNTVISVTIACTLDLVHAQISAEVREGDNTKTVVLEKNYDDENQVFSVDVDKKHKMTVENLENAREQEVKKPVKICKNKDDQLDVDISRKTYYLPL